MKIIKQGFSNDSQSKEDTHTTRKGKSTEAGLWYKPLLKLTLKCQLNFLFTFRLGLLRKACFFWAWCWPSAQREISPLRMTITPSQSHAAVGAPQRRMAGLGIPYAFVGPVGKLWLNLMSLCILMKKITFLVLTDKKRTQKGSCTLWACFYSVGQEIQCCSAWLGARAGCSLSHSQREEGLLLGPLPAPQRNHKAVSVLTKTNCQNLSDSSIYMFVSVLHEGKLISFTGLWIRLT